MNNLIRKSYPPHVKIAEIINSFEQYAFGDIRHNVFGSEGKKDAKPIAAFILMSCLIDQMAAFRYNHGKRENERYYKEFIALYLKKYVPYDLYTNLRCLLVHNYSIGEYLSISEDETIKGNTTPSNSFTAKAFLSDLEKAFQLFKADLLAEGEARTNALLRYDEVPPIVGVERHVLLYSNEEADFLISHYSEKLKGKTAGPNHQLRVYKLIKEVLKNENEEPVKADSPYRVLCVARYSGEEHFFLLNEITQRHQLEYPIEVLNKCGLFPISNLPIPNNAG